jgi:hypothetical protein
VVMRRIVQFLSSYCSRKQSSWQQRLSHLSRIDSHRQTLEKFGARATVKRSLIIFVSLFVLISCSRLSGKDINQAINPDLN